MAGAFAVAAFQSNAFQITVPFAATIAGTGGVTANLADFYTLEASISGLGAVVADLIEVARLNAVITGLGGMTVDMTQVHQLAAVLSGQGDLSVDEGFLRDGVTLVAEAINPTTVRLSRVV